MNVVGDRSTSNSRLQCINLVTRGALFEFISCAEGDQQLAYKGGEPRDWRACRGLGEDVQHQDEEGQSSRFLPAIDRSGLEVVCYFAIIILKLLGPGVESAAQLFLQQLATAPCCSCLAPAQLQDAQPSLWATHSSRPSMEAVLRLKRTGEGFLPSVHEAKVMKTQLDLLRSRDGSSSSAVKGLSMPSHGLGPGVALKAGVWVR